MLAEIPINLSERNDAMAKIALPNNNEQILAACYQMDPPRRRSEPSARCASRRA